VILWREIDRIDFALGLVKAPSGRRDNRTNSDPRGKESVYVALPFKVPDFQIRHELPGCTSEPVTDLFDGACTAFYAVRHFTDIANGKFGVTVSATESSLVEYDYPRSCPIRSGQEDRFEKTKTPIATSRVYLYLMNNMFDVNVRWDQPGAVRFTYALRSHAGDWRTGKADEFGWDCMNPFIVVPVEGTQAEGRPAVSGFVTVDPPNVVLTTLKPAEANGRGIILRFVETQGRATEARVALPFLPPVTATATNLVEDDRPERLAVGAGNRVAVALRPFGVATVRVTCAAGRAEVTDARAAPTSDMSIAVFWGTEAARPDDISHYCVYRGTTPDFAPGLRTLVGRPVKSRYLDVPRLKYGGWINNRLEPETTYYYRVAAVDRWNNEGPASAAVAVATLAAAAGNRAPRRVECLRAIPVSPLSRWNFVNLMWRTNCESDVARYEIHRATTFDFTPGAATRIGIAEADAVIKGGNGYGEVPIDHRAGEYDHMMFLDETVAPDTAYFYRVRAVDAAGQPGRSSSVVFACTRAAPGPAAKATASSVYAPEYGPERAIDGSPDPYAAWISKPYGGGTKEAPTDAWLAVEFPAAVALRGVVIAGDERPVIPPQERLRVEYRENGAWKLAAEACAATGTTIRATWATPFVADAVRVYVPVADLPRSTRADIPDGVVRVCELLLVLDDGRELSPADIWP
jgi:hypothetical protein